MDLAQSIVVAIGVIGFFITIGSFLYMARSDYRHLDAKIDAIRELAHAIHKETQASLTGIREEMKDFHNRLCAIEERRVK